MIHMSFSLMRGSFCIAFISMLFFTIYSLYATFKQHFANKKPL